MEKVKEPLVRIGRRLPKKIKEPLKQLYSKWYSNVILDKRLIKDLAEFYNTSYNYSWFELNYEEAVNLCKVAIRINADLWKALNPNTEEEIKIFYEAVPYYPFELIYWHMERGQRKFREKVIKYSFGDVLDYGGGPGDLSVKLAEKGFNVTYVDVQGWNKQFAEWLFKRRGYKIEVLDVEKDEEKLWGKEYDTIICIDVIEHIPHPEIVLERMARCLKENGKLIITKLKSSGPVEDNPMHFEVNFDEAEKLLNSFRVVNSGEYEWLWIKKEDDKIKELKRERGDEIS